MLTMGMDIHIHIVKNGEYVVKNIYTGRNSDWFDNMMGNGYDDCYNYLDLIFGISPQAPKNLDAKELSKKGYFDFFYVSVKNFKNWFKQYRPDISAGWVSTYDKWRIEHKGYIPEYMAYTLTKEDILEDMHFVEVTNPYDPSAFIYSFLIENDIDDNADITYWFDN